VGILDLFAPLTLLDLDLMTFIYELDPHSFELYWMCESGSSFVNAFDSYRLTDTTKIIYHAASQVVSNSNYDEVLLYLL